MVELSRRWFLGGLGAGIIAAPAIVRAASLMPVKALEREIGFDALLGPGDRGPYLVSADDLITRLQAVTRRVFVPRLHVQIYDASPLMRGLLESSHG